MLRSFLVFLHRWTGLLMAAFLIVVSLTGAILPFSLPLERLINPQLFATAKPGQKPLDLASLAVAAERQEPQARVGYFALTQPDQVSIHMAPRKNKSTGKDYLLSFDHVLLDPFTGAELGRRREGDLSQGRINIVPFILVLHESLALGEAGSWVLGIVALAWTIDCAVSFYLTLPVASGQFFRRWKPAWLIKWPAGTFRLNFDLHRASGLWLLPLLFVFAWSSVMFNLSPVYEGVMRRVANFTPLEDVIKTRTPTHPGDHPKLDWYAAQSRGAQLLAELARIHHFKVYRPFGIAYLPELGVYDYDVRSSLDVGGLTFETSVWLDGNTGALQKVFVANGEHAGDTITRWLYALHWADFHDWLAYRIIVSLLGLVIAGLSITGAVIWWVKRSARQSLKRKIVALAVPQQSEI